MTSGSMWNHYRDEVNDDAIETAANRRLNNNTISSKSSEYNAQIIGRALANNDELDTDVVVPFKYLSNFWRSLDIRFINEVPADPAADPPIGHFPE